MGFISDVATRLRSAFSKDKEQAATQLAKGVVNPSGSGNSLLSAYGYDALSNHLRLESDLLARYADYEEMDEYPEIAAAVDIFADDASQPDTSLNRTLWVSSPDSDIQANLDDLFQNTLRLDEDIWEIARTLVLYGNDFEELLVTKDGVRGLNFLPAPTVRRMEGPHGQLYGFLQDFRGKFSTQTADFQTLLAARNASIRGGATPLSVANENGLVAFEDWEVLHFRLRGKQRRSVYGHSVLEPARWIWKRLLLLEDAALIYRLQRAPERYAFYIDVGDLPPQEALAYVNRVRQQFRKKKFVNPSSGKLELKYDPLSSDEDFFIPSRKGTDSTRVETLGAPQWQCLVGDTRIPLLDGTSPTIQELSDRDRDFWVYSVDSTGRVVPGRARSARKTHDAAEIWEVTLDSGKTVRCTGNHPFLTRDGKWLLAEHLKAGDSLMPLYRKESSHGAGDKVEGYEKVYDPASNEWVYTHHRVFEDTTGADLSTYFRKGNVIHHADFSKRNNAPENLEGMARRDHTKLHANSSANGWKNPERRERHRQMMIERMADKVLRADKAKILTEWNQSEDHKQRIRGENNPNWRDLTVADLEYLAIATGARGIHEFIQKARVSQTTIYRVLATEGLTWNDFAAKNIPGWVPKGRAVSAMRLENHKVVSVRNTGETAAVYDLTVETHANFAVESGIFVSNSMEDVSYFRDKLFAALKVPKAYMGQEEGVARAVLSSEDVRFARAVLRVQRELKNGFRKCGRIHLAAQGMDPYRVPYELHMTVPSAIFELAQLEVRNARADLATRMKEFVSLKWLLSRVFGLSDEEIEVVIEQRGEDIMRDAIDQAQGQAEAMAMGGMSPDGMPVGEMPPEGEEPPPEGGEEEPPEGEESKGREKQSKQKLLNYLVSERKKRSDARAYSKSLGGISERELLAGDREAEKRADDKLNSLLKNDQTMTKRLYELNGLLKDIRATTQMNGHKRH